MTLDTGTAVAIINLIIGTGIVVMSVITTRRLKGGHLAWVSRAFFILACLYIVHAGIEVLGLGQDIYAVSALVATLLLGFTMVIIDISIKDLGV